MVCAWNKERFVNALLNIGQNVGNLFEYDKINHMATYIYPIGLTIVYNGNHSTLSGILKEKERYKQIRHMILYQHMIICILMVFISEIK